MKFICKQTIYGAVGVKGLVLKKRLLLDESSSRVFQQKRRDMSELWLCKNHCGFAVGVVKRGKYPTLDVFRLAQPAMNPALDDYVVTSLESGTVECSNCHHTQIWHLSDYALERMLSRRQSRHKTVVK